MKKSIFFLPILLFLAGCPGKGREGAESGERRAIYVDGSRVCFTIDKNDVLTRYILSTNGREYKKLLVGDFKYLTYPSTCFTVNLEKGLVYGAVIPPFFGALKSRGHAACAKRCFGV